MILRRLARSSKVFSLRAAVGLLKLSAYVLPAPRAWSVSNLSPTRRATQHRRDKGTSLEHQAKSDPTEEGTVTA